MSTPRNVRQDPGGESNEKRSGLQLPSTGPHPALIDVAAGRGLPLVTDPMPLLRSASAHGMAVLLLSEIERTDPPWRRIGLAVLAARQASVRSWHERLWAALAAISAILDDAGIDVAIAKGIAAEARWYARMGERPSNDLDLLLSPAHLDRIDDVVAAIEPSHPLCGKVRRFAQAGNLQSIDLEYEGVPIDLHWDILKLGIPSRNREAIWERTIPFTLPDGRSIRTLDAECSYVHFLLCTSTRTVSGDCSGLSTWLGSTSARNLTTLPCNGWSAPRGSRRASVPPGTSWCARLASTLPTNSSVPDRFVPSSGTSHGAPR
jgi:Uncharacterised nucleotidyltransferase